MHRRSLLWICFVILAMNLGRLQAQEIAPAASNHRVFVPIVLNAGSAPGGGTATHTGEATYYKEADGGGNCMFDPTPQDLMVGAMNHVDYAGAALCGAYVEIAGPKGTITVRVVDQCPPCAAGDIDLSPQAFAQIADLVTGRVPITWRIVSPDISGPVRYRFKEGSSQWWTAVQIRNHRNPIAKVEYLDATGKFKAIPRTDYNYFVASSGMGPGPYTLRVTDSYGNVLTNSGISLKVGVEIAGSGQFPKAP